MKGKNAVNRKPKTHMGEGRASARAAFGDLVRRAKLKGALVGDALVTKISKPKEQTHG